MRLLSFGEPPNPAERFKLTVMTPDEYLKTVVEPNFAEFSADYSSVRLALNLVHSVDALAAHVYHASNGSAPGSDDTHYRDILANQDSEYRLLRDIAKAVKHVRLKRSSPQIRSRRIAFEYVRSDGEKALGRLEMGGPPQVIAHLDDGQSRSVETIALNALNLLKQEMTKYSFNNAGPN